MGTEGAEAHLLACRVTTRSLLGELPSCRQTETTTIMPAILPNSIPIPTHLGTDFGLSPMAYRLQKAKRPYSGSSSHLNLEQLLSPSQCTSLVGKTMASVITKINIS